MLSGELDGPVFCVRCSSLSIGLLLLLHDHFGRSVVGVERLAKSGKWLHVGRKGVGILFFGFLL